MDELPRRELFDEELYLRTFPDIAVAVRDGELSSGYEHWALHGRFELACGQREAGSSFLLATAGLSSAGSGANDHLSSVDLLGNPTAGETLRVVAESDIVQEQAERKPAKRPWRGRQSGHAEAAFLVRDQRRVKSSPAHRDAELIRNLMNTGDIARAAAVIADAADAAGPSDTEVLLLAFGIFRRAHLPPGRLIIKALQSRLTDAQYRSLVTTWTQYCRAGLSETEVESLLTAVPADREIPDGTPDSRSAALNDRLFLFLLATMIGSIGLPAALQIRVFHHVRRTTIREPDDTVRSQIWPILQPALDDYLKIVAARSMLGGSSDLASLATEYVTSLFREFGEQNIAERMRLLRHKAGQERDQLLAAVQHNPEDARSVLRLAEAYFQMGDFGAARNWYTRRIEMGGNDEEVYWAMFRLAAAMAELDEPWPDVENAYLRAWIFRPTRAEALHAMAVRYRLDQRYRLGYLLAEQAAEIPLPGEDIFVSGYFAEIYAWRALEEQAACARWAGKHTEAFALCRRLIARPDIPDSDRQRIAINRDASVPAMLAAAAPSPEAVVQSLIAEPGDPQIAVTFIAGPERQILVESLNSFLTCCLDVSRVGRFLVLDTGLSARDRTALQHRYRFLEFVRRTPTSKQGTEVAQLHAQIDSRYWLHVGQGWQFFAPENFIARLIAVLEAEPQVSQVGVNFADAEQLIGAAASEDLVRRTPDAGRYLFTETLAHGPAMFDTSRLDLAIGSQHTKLNSPVTRTVSLDEVFCIQQPSGPGQHNRLAPALVKLRSDIVRLAHQSKTIRRMNSRFSRIPLSATPLVDVKRVAQTPFHDGQNWSTTGGDPSFQLHLPPGSTQIPAGWYVLGVALRLTAGRLTHPKLYRDHGDGFREPDTDVFVLADDTAYHQLLVKFERPVYALRLDPSDSSDITEFVLGNLQLHRVHPLEAMLRLTGAEIRQMRDQDETRSRIMQRALVTLFRGPTKALQNQRTTHEGIEYAEWVRTYDTLTESMRARIRVDINSMETKPLISIILPVYNTPERWLRACLESVRKQMYDAWELCIADDASTESHVRSILQEYSAKDSRIKIIFREDNGHISAASNSALELATGNYIALLDHDDVLAEHALFYVAQAITDNPEARLIYSDEDKIDSKGKRYHPYFKPNWNPVLFLGHNMFNHLGVYHLELVRAVGGFREGYEGSQDYDLVFRCMEQITRAQIIHIPRILYHWRAAEGSTALQLSEKNYTVDAAEKSINDHFQRQGISAEIEPIVITGSWRVRYHLPEPQPSASIIIPTRNGGETLRRCLDSIRKNTKYSNYEIVIVDNQSDEPETLGLFEEERLRENHRVILFDEPFNYSRLNNFAARQCDADILVFLNDDTEVITEDWLRELASIAVQSGVGAVGAMLYYPDDHIQHAGVILGPGGVAGHAYPRKPRGYPGDQGRALLVQELSAVTGACMAMKRERFEDVSGFDESLAVAFNDVDLCIRLTQKGYNNVWTPNAELYHHESLTRGLDITPEKARRFEGECETMRSRWSDILLNDPYYHPAFSLDFAADFMTYSSPRN